MKRIFGLVLSVFLALQAMTVFAAAPEEAVIAEAAAIQTEEAEAVVTLTDVICNPGEKISVEILFDSSVPVNSIALHNLTYDTERLEFLGFGEEGDLLSKSLFGAQGIDRNLNTVVLGMMNSEAYSGKICSLLFRAKADAGYGMAEVSMEALIKDNSDDIETAVDTSLVAAGHVDFTIGSAAGSAGETIAVPIFVDTVVPVNSIALSAPVYDTDILTFVGFSDYSDIVTESYFGTGGIDQQKQVITIALNNSQPVSGYLCSILFRVNEGAQGGLTEIGLTSLVKNYADEIYSTVQFGSVVVGNVEFFLGSARGEVGDTVSVDVTVADCTLSVDSIMFSDLSYDTKALTFIGYNFVGGEMTDDSCSIPCNGQVLSDGTVCTLKFRVNENASTGIFDISLSAAAMISDVAFDFDVQNGYVAVGKTEISLGTATGISGNMVAIDVIIDSNVALDSFTAKNLTYDTAALTFVGFGDYEEFAAKCTQTNFDSTDAVPSFSFTLKEPEMLSDTVVCKAYFKINEGAADGVIDVGFSALVTTKNGVYFCTASNSGSVVIRNRVLGDINDDGCVDIADALALFRHIMMPNSYSIDYPGRIDFTKDGSLDIRDSLRLFQYSMLPERYPIEW